MKLDSMLDLYVMELRDIYNAEKQLMKALPKMAKAATNEELAGAFMAHLEETERHAERVEQIVDSLGKRAAGKPCEAMKGLIEEGAELMEADASEDVLDAGLIVAAQKVEHYEIASYGSLCAFAKILGRKQDLKLLEETLNEEKNTDALLSRLAESFVNREAVA